MRKILYIFLCFLVFRAPAQEVLSELEFNRAVQLKAREFKYYGDAPMVADTSPVNLPFYEDFREQSVFPLPERWADRYGFVNTDIPLFPVTYGAVTLDAINDTGTMYPHAIPGPQTFIADYLTSRYIRLDSVFVPVTRALTRADSIFFSFWYQPQGRGRAPQKPDSLILQFLVEPGHDSITPTDTTFIPDRWRTVWRSEGMSLDTFLYRYNRHFMQVIIPVSDSSAFYKKFFRFRFMNKVSLASQSEPSWQSNADHWNIDEVYLNLGRSINDTVLAGITFIERPPSLLKKYSAMPYTQYCEDPTNEIDDTLDVLMSNRDIVDHNATYNYRVRDIQGSFDKSYDGGQYIMKPFYQFGFVTYAPFAHPPLPFLIPIGSAQRASFSMVHTLTAVDGSGLADTITGIQDFHNFFSYDDGTPDAGYGLTGAGAQLAYQFRLNRSPDTLRAIQIYFNHTLSKANEQFFNLCVWNDNNGKPGTRIYNREVWTMFSDSLYEPVTYYLEEPVRITERFYVGMEQSTDDNLNIGFDRYYNSQDYLFFNVTGQWNTSAYSGSLMIRPVVGPPLPLGVDHTVAEKSPLILYPNPASGILNVANLPAGKTNLSALIIDITGREVMSANPHSSINISQLTNGIYILTVLDQEDRVLGRARFVVAK